MKSILQPNNHECYLCHRTSEPLDRHHIFGGALRGNAEKYGLTVYLCHRECHIFGPHSAHQSADTTLYLREQAQRAAMDYYGWTVEEFRQRFGKSYL